MDLNAAAWDGDEMYFATEWCHGTPANTALRILDERVLRRGTQKTAELCGLWHGRHRKAVEYARPGKLGSGHYPVLLWKSPWGSQGGLELRLWGSVGGEWAG